MNIITSFVDRLAAGAAASHEGFFNVRFLELGDYAIPVSLFELGVVYRWRGSGVDSIVGKG